MANEKSLLEQYNGLPAIVRILIQLFVGPLASCVYRVLRYIETKNTKTLVIAIIAALTGAFCGVLALIDLITLIFKGGYTVLVD